LVVFALAARSSLLRQVTFLHHIGKQRWVHAIGEANDIIEALRRGTVNVGERRKRRPTSIAHGGA
jgi:hypothetical protein